MHNSVIPVKTGIQSFKVVSRLWIPAYAGMTDFLRLYQVWILYTSSVGEASPFLGV